MRQEIQKLKQSQFKIDQILDQIEDITEEFLVQQQQRLFQSLWQIYPHLREDQEAAWEEWNQSELLEAQIIGIENLLAQITEHLHIAIQARRSIKGRGLFNYIFGMSPNFVIERQLFGIHALIANAEPHIANILQQDSSKAVAEFLRHLLPWIEELKITCRKSWSFRHLDLFFAKTEPFLGKFMDEAKHLHEQAVLRRHSLSEEIRSWLDKNEN